MIPKIIHYCWFGGNPLSELAIKCIDSWKKYCPDYEIIQWNETNYDIKNCCDYVREAYDEKKWAFVSDYARLEIIYNNGGVYLDTDVELLRPLDTLLNNRCYFGAETTGYVATGLGFGAEKNNEIVKRLLDEYDNVHFIIGNKMYDLTPCPIRNSKPLVNLGYEYSDDKIWLFEDKCVVYPPDYFCPMDYGNLAITSNSFSVHLYNASWLSEDEKRINEKINTIDSNYYPIYSFLKKHILLYKFEKNKGTVKNIFDYFQYKLNKRKNMN